MTSDYLKLWRNLGSHNEVAGGSRQRGRVRVPCRRHRRAPQGAGRVSAPRMPRLKRPTEVLLFEQVALTDKAPAEKQRYLPGLAVASTRTASLRAAGLCGRRVRRRWFGSSAPAPCPGYFA